VVDSLASFYDVDILIKDNHQLSIRCRWSLF